MKELKTMSGKTFFIDDDECEKIKSMVKEEYRGIIGLKSGELVNINSVDSISNLEMEAYYMGNKMNRDKTKVFVGGEWKFFAGNISEIEYKPKILNHENSNYKQLRG